MSPEKPDARQVWERLMPGSTRDRLIFAVKVAAGAAGLAGVMAAFAAEFGWPAVLRFAAVLLGLLVVFFSGFLHYRAWIAIREEIQRVNEAAADAKNLEDNFVTAMKEMPKILDDHARETVRLILIELKEPLERGGFKLSVPPKDPPSPTAPAPAPPSSRESSE